MARKRYIPGQIIGMVRVAGLGLAQGEKVGAICRSLGISEQSYYRWRYEYGGLKGSQAKRFKDLGKEKRRFWGVGWPLILCRAATAPTLRWRRRPDQFPLPIRYTNPIAQLYLQKPALNQSQQRMATSVHKS